MTDEVPVLSMDEVREEAREILSAIDASQRHQEAFEENWRKLWQLLREAKVSQVPFRDSDSGPWNLTGDPVHGPYDYLLSSLTGGSFSVPIWPPEDARLGIDLAKLLNWAGVPV